MTSLGAETAVGAEEDAKHPTANSVENVMQEADQTKTNVENVHPGKNGFTTWLQTLATPRRDLMTNTNKEAAATNGKARSASVPDRRAAFGQLNNNNWRRSSTGVKPPLAAAKNASAQTKHHQAQGSGSRRSSLVGSDSTASSDSTSDASSDGGCSVGPAQQLRLSPEPKTELEQLLAGDVEALNAWSPSSAVAIPPAGTESTTTSTTSTTSATSTSTITTPAKVSIAAGVCVAVPSPRSAVAAPSAFRIRQVLQRMQHWPNM
jgi:hypothetical protein